MSHTGKIVLVLGLAMAGLTPAAYAQWGGGTIGGPPGSGAAAVNPAPILGQLETASQSLYLRVANTGVPTSMLNPQMGTPAGGFVTFNPALGNALSSFWGAVRGIQRGGVTMNANPYTFSQDMAQLQWYAQAVDTAMATGVSDPGVQLDWARCRQLLALLTGANPANAMGPAPGAGYPYPGGMGAAGGVIVTPALGSVTPPAYVGANWRGGEALVLVRQLQEQVQLCDRQARAALAPGDMAGGGFVSLLDQLVARTNQLSGVAGDSFAYAAGRGMPDRTLLDDCRGMAQSLDARLASSGLQAQVGPSWSTVRALMDQLGSVVCPLEGRRRRNFQALWGDQ